MFIYVSLISHKEKRSLCCANFPSGDTAYLKNQYLAYIFFCHQYRERTSKENKAKIHCIQTNIHSV